MSGDKEEHSGGLASLMKVLNEAENNNMDEHHSYCINESDNCDESSKLLVTRAHPVESQKKYIWDELYDKDVISSLHSDSDGDSQTILSLDENEAKESEHSRETRIKMKLKKMKVEYDNKSKHVIHLRTVLARKKVASERKLKLLEGEWGERFTKQKNEHEKKAKELQDLIAQTKIEIDSCNQKKTTLTNELLHIEDSRQALCATLEANGKTELLKLQQKWIRDEHKRLTSISKQKSVELKKQAAKALEPELRSIVQKHKDELQRKRDEIELDLKTTKKRLKLKNADMLAKKKNEIETKERHRLHELDEKYESRIKDMKLEHQKKIEEMNKRLQDEIDSAKDLHKVHLKEREALEKERLTKIQLQHEKQINDATKQMETEVKEYQSECDEKVEIAMKKYNEEFEAWKLEHHRNIQEQYSKRKREDERLLQEKADEDIQIVKEKLRLELEAKKKELLCGKDSAIDTMKSALEVDIDKELKRGKELEKEHEQVLSERESASQALSELQNKLSRTNVLYEKIQNEVKQETERLAQCEIVYRNKDLVEEQQLKSNLLQQKQDIESLTKAVSELEAKLKDRRIENEQEINRLLNSNQEEISMAESKIEDILRKKQTMIIKKQKALSSLNAKVKEFDLQLADVREQQIFKNSNNSFQ